ncbi:TM2 domain-containing protein [Spirulina major]|nr:TM2 domain-containing protein [Spirulina major]
MGYTKLGIFQIITCGGCGIWALIDFIQILTGGLKDSDGRDLQDS